MSEKERFDVTRPLRFALVKALNSKDEKLRKIYSMLAIEVILFVIGL